MSTDFYSDDVGSYAVPDLWEIAREQMPSTILLADLLGNPKIFQTTVACSDLLDDVVGFVRRACEADLSYPILLTPDGWLCDGAHRLVRAVFERRPSIQVIQLTRMPDPILF